MTARRRVAGGNVRRHAVLVSLPLAYALHGMIAAHLGASLAADAAASGINYDWWQEFSSQATGLATTFVPTITGFAAPC